MLSNGPGEPQAVQILSPEHLLPEKLAKTPIPAPDGLADLQNSGVWVGFSPFGEVQRAAAPKPQD